MPQSFYIFGSSGDPETYFSRHVAERIAKIAADVEIRFEVLLELDYIMKLQELKLTEGGGYYSHSSTHCIVRNGNILGDLISLVRVAEIEFGIENAEIANNALFEKLSKDETVNLIEVSGNRAVYLDLIHEVPGDDPFFYGKIIIEL
jgi:hypothetical protein